MESKSCQLISFFHFGCKMNMGTFNFFVKKNNVFLNKDLKNIKIIADKIFSKSVSILVSIDTYPILPKAIDAFPVKLTDGGKIYIVVFKN